MPVSIIRSWNEAATYLTELRDTVRANVRPLTQIPGGAPFTVCREVFCYVDHLGHLFTGLNGRGDVGRRFTQFLREVLGQIDPGYRQWADVIYQIFRNGPVHEFAPKVLENNAGQVLGWGFYPGARGDAVQGPHLSPKLMGPGWYNLVVSVPSLLDDLERSIELLTTLGPNQQLGPENERVTLWNRAARELLEPKACNFSVLP